MQLTTIESPIGPLSIAARGRRVCLLHFGADEDYILKQLGSWYPNVSVEPHPDPAGAIGRLAEYFDGRLDALDDVEVELNGTAFQQRVWKALRGIRAGSTSTYAALAAGVGAPSAVRAVGAANGANPVAVIVPCHRVIGSNGRLTGYGGGLDRKEWLLRHEGAAVGLF